MKVGPLGEIYLEKRQFLDPRGSLTRVYDSSSFNFVVTDFKPAEIFFSSSRKGAIRGIHCPISNIEFWRMIGVVHGEVQDVLIDLRLDSPTYGMVTRNLLTDTSPFMLVPMGVGHGFQSLVENSQMLYVFGVPYAETRETGVNPQSTCFSWPHEASVISVKDKALPFYGE